MIYFHLQISQQNSSFGMTFVKWARKKMGIEIVFWGSSPFHSTSGGHNSLKAARPRLRGWHLSDRRQPRHQSWWRRRCWKARCGGGDPLGDFFGQRGRLPNQSKATCPPRHRSKAKPIHALHSEIIFIVQLLLNQMWPRALPLMEVPTSSTRYTRFERLRMCRPWLEKKIATLFGRAHCTRFLINVWLCHSFNFGEKAPGRC